MLRIMLTSDHSVARGIGPEQAAFNQRPALPPTAGGNWASAFTSLASVSPPNKMGK